MPPAPIGPTLELLAAAPATLAARAAAFAVHDAGRRSAADGFSVIEQAWHLADVEERAFGVRIRRLRDEDRPALQDFDGAAAAVAGRYGSRTLKDGIAAFARARATNLEALSALDAPGWRRPGQQDGVGAVTLADIPRLMAEHDAAHALELDALRAGFIGEVLAATPARLAAELEGFDPDALRRPPLETPSDAERLSPIGHASHLRDIELEGYHVRIRRLRAEDAPRLESLPGDRMAIERRYDTDSVSGVLGAFAAASTQTVATLNAVAAEEWTRAGQFDAYGPVTLLGLIEIIAGHDAAHLRALKALPHGTKRAILLPIDSNKRL